MKKRIRIFSCLLAAFLLLTPLRAGAEALLSEEYCRAIDFTETMPEEELADMDAMACEFAQNYQLDIVLLAAPEREIGASGRELAESVYEEGSFGWGEDRSGVLYLYHADTGLAEAFLFGSAADRLPAEILTEIELDIPLYFEDYGIWGVMAGAVLNTEDWLDGSWYETADGSDGNSASGMPYWYPADVSSFRFFHDETADRVVDDADIFTPEEEAQLRSRIAEVTAMTGKDVVVFTDTSAYGLTHAVCAADFYDFNGYGFGPEREGMCLMICMDPDDRGWWACATGSETMALYTESSANALDDALYAYMANGKYAQGVLDWIGSIGTLYTKGIPFAPAWFPDTGAGWTRTQDASAPRVVDDRGLFTAEQCADLTQKAAAISEKYGVDVVLTTVSDYYHMTAREYADSFYAYRGYGLGSDNSGILLTVSSSYDGAYCRSFAYGGVEMTQTNEERLNDQSSELVDSGDSYGAAVRWLSNVEHMLRTGRVARPLFSWIGSGLFGLLFGAPVGLAGLKKAKRNMNTAVEAANADSYVDRETLLIAAVSDTFVNETVQRIYRPDTPSSSGGGGGSGGGGSSYSGSYSGSSGSSHSGSGRSF